MAARFPEQRRGSLVGAVFLVGFNLSCFTIQRQLDLGCGDWRIVRGEVEVDDQDFAFDDAHELVGFRGRHHARGSGHPGCGRFLGAVVVPLVCQGTAPEHSGTSKRGCTQCMRAGTMKGKVHRKSRVPAKPWDRSPERSGENGRSWWAVEGARLRARASPHHRNGRLGLRHREHRVDVPDDRIAVADRVAAVRVVRCRSFLRFPFMLHPVCNGCSLGTLV